MVHSGVVSFNVLLFQVRQEWAGVKANWLAALTEGQPCLISVHRGCVNKVARSKDGANVI